MPNPDFGCNAHIKFGKMKDYAVDRLNADYIARYGTLCAIMASLAKLFQYQLQQQQVV